MTTPATATPIPLATLDAVLERITYANEETGYTVARVATRGGGTDLLTVVGALLGAQPGESLRMQGLWMLQRNLLYTAVTRARRIVVLVGSKRAISNAVRTEGAERRADADTLTTRSGYAGVGAIRSRVGPPHGCTNPCRGNSAAA